MNLRVVSLAPSATATLVAMDADSLLVGTTSHCAHPASAVGAWLTPDYESITALEPDLVLTVDPLQASVRDELRDRGFETYHAEPTTLSDLFVSWSELSTVVGREAAGERLVANARDRLAAVRTAVADRDRPVVYCEEWPDPPMAAGNWVPEAVEAAGGRYPFLEPGSRSHRIDAETVEARAPAHVVLHYCGRGTNVDPATVTGRGWSLPAVENDCVHVADDALLNQPSPNLLCGIETLAETIHPDAFASG